MDSSKLSNNEKRVYYSGSVNGAPNIDINFPWELVQHMISSGITVFDPHVAARNEE